ncbi:MAG: cytochrome C oxidase subunit IV family protein [Methylovulum sp.]|nr:cytochrome C oxidase subunit IV family protein [Methylovulum sp.]
MKPFSIENRPELATYLSGFFLALLLTLLAFGIVCAQTGIALQPISFVLGRFPQGAERLREMPHWLVISGIFVLAVLQITVHLWYFLHLDFSPRQRMKVHAILFSLCIMFIIICGTLWIMQDLGNQMSPISSGR